MTDQTAPASAGGAALPDVDSIDSIFTNAVPEATTENLEGKAPEPEAPEAEPKEEAFPKKAVNAISRRDKQIGKLRAELEHARRVQQDFEQRATQAKPEQTKDDGRPKEADFTNYADFMKAEMRYELTQELAKRDGKIQETQQSAQEQAWRVQREQTVATQAQAFVKDNPEALALVDEYADVVDSYSPALQKLFLDADNAPLAFFNLAKEGRLEALADMSLAKAAMEIGRAQSQAVTPPKSKAPAPLPASRGSVPGSKPYEKYTPTEAWNLLTQKE